MKLISLIFCNIFCVTFIASKNDFELSFENNSCTVPESSIMSVVNCGLSKNLKRRTLFMELQFSQDITLWHLNFKTTIPRKPIDYVLLNVSNVNGCQLLDNKNQMTLLQLGRATIERYSNLPRHCPILKNKLYYIRGFRFDLELFPAFGFESDFIVWYEFIVQKKLAFSGYVTSHVGLKHTKKRRN